MIQIIITVLLQVNSYTNLINIYYLMLRRCFFLKEVEELSFVASSPRIRIA